MVHVVIINVIIKLLYNCWLNLTAMFLRGFPGGAVLKNLPASAEDMSSVPGREDLEEAMATHSSIAWKTPWTQ